MSRQILADGIELSGGDYAILAVVLAIAFAALGVGYILSKEVVAAGQGTQKMQEIAKAVQEGAIAYLKRQRNTLVIFGALVFVLLFFLPAEDWNERIGRSLAFLVGATFSFLIGYAGMWLATQANLRVAAASREPGGREKAMRIAFRTGGTVGMLTVGLGLAGAVIVVMVYTGQAPRVLEGFGFGAALIAMFMRVGGGIFTKAADVGADLVGKVENNIPEDDPRNAATIADNVGDNVGDCAGMAADLFESYAVTLVAALILGSVYLGADGLVFPLVVPAIGVITAVIGIYITRAKAGVNGLTTINQSFYISAVISAVLCTIAALVFLPSEFIGEDGSPVVVAIVSVIIGIVLAGVILWLTGYYTGTENKPVKTVGETSETGAATVILSGISLGLESAVYTSLVIGGAVFGAYLVGGAVGLFAVALAGTGLLTTVGVIVAMDTFGPVSDNAQGIAEMSGDVDGEAAGILTELDAVGNTTKAITKGIAIATAVLAATALFASYQQSIIDAIRSVGDAAMDASEYTQKTFLTDITGANVLVGVILGAAVVFLFSGLAINAVARSAGAVVREVRRQFREIPGIMEGTGKPEYGRVVDLVTKDSQQELATPGLLAVFAPIAVGFGLGTGALAGFLGGAIGAGVLMAVFLANAGGAWDNAKKLVEDGNHGGKGSEQHAATVIGDTVGDPFKDTAGPAINPLLKVMNLVSLLIAPAIVQLSIGADASPVARVLIALVSVAIIVAAIVVSKRRGGSLTDTPSSSPEAAAKV